MQKSRWRAEKEEGRANDLPFHKNTPMIEAQSIATSYSLFPGDFPLLRES